MKHLFTQLNSVCFFKRLGIVGFVISFSIFVSGCACVSTDPKDLATCGKVQCCDADYDDLVTDYIKTHYNAPHVVDTEVTETLKNIEVCDPAPYKYGCMVCASFDVLNTANLELDHGPTYNIIHYKSKFYIQGGAIVSVWNSHTTEVVVRDEMTW